MVYPPPNNSHPCKDFQTTLYRSSPWRTRIFVCGLLTIYLRPLVILVLDKEGFLCFSFLPRMSPQNFSPPYDLPSPLLALAPCSVFCRHFFRLATPGPQLSFFPGDMISNLSTWSVFTTLLLFLFKTCFRHGSCPIFFVPPQRTNDVWLCPVFMLRLLK